MSDLMKKNLDNLIDSINNDDTIEAIKSIAEITELLIANNLSVSIPAIKRIILPIIAKGEDYIDSLNYHGITEYSLTESSEELRERDLFFSADLVEIIEKLTRLAKDIHNIEVKESKSISN